MDDLYSYLIGGILIIGSIATAFFKGQGSGKTIERVKTQKTQLAAQAKEATLSVEIQKNNEKIDRLAAGDVDKRLHNDFRDDDDL